jgi:hypothetical protein
MLNWYSLLHQPNTRKELVASVLFQSGEHMSSLKGPELQDFIEAHCVTAIVRTSSYWDNETRLRQYGFYKVVKPMQVFKRVHHGENYVRAIANLVIPVGAMIYVNPAAFWKGQCSDSRKMRASEAFVHSLATQRTGRPLLEARSGYSYNFKYHIGKTVKPELRFSKQAAQCESGIHFFVNLADAKTWS